MAAGLLSGISDFLFGTVDNQQYLQQFAKEQLAAEQARQQAIQAQAMQQRFGQYLQAVMNGTAPSMAQLQLQQGLGTIASQQQSMASGVSGPGAALARYGAAINTGAAQTATNQAAAIARAKELADARAAYGANAAAIAGGATNLYNIGSQNMLGLGGIASGSGIAQFNRQEQDKGLGALFQGVGQAGAAYFGRQPSTGGGSSAASDGAAYSAAAPGQADSNINYGVNS